MHMPMWIRDHFNNLQELDIRICKLEEEGLIILGEMPNLKKLTLRFEVVPREPVVISRQGFAMIRTFTVDSRVPRVTFQEGAMPMLGLLVFEFRFYAGSPNKDHVGINHLGSLGLISFDYNQDWYDSLQCIRRSIDAMRKEAQKHRNNVECYLRGRQEHKNWNCQMLPPLNESIDSMPTPPPLPLQIDMETCKVDMETWYEGIFFHLSGHKREYVRRYLAPWLSFRPVFWNMLFVSKSVVCLSYIIFPTLFVAFTNLYNPPSLNVYLIISATVHCHLHYGTE
jgi:hypothetical protein